MFVFCDWVQNETLGDERTALLQLVPLESLSKRREKLFTEGLQNCTGRESTSRSISQSRSHRQTKLVKRCPF